MLEPSNKTTIIGVCGFKSSGKDTTADYLGHNYGYVSNSLADPMKEFLYSVFKFPKEHLWGSSSLREVPDERYEFTGLDPLDGSQLALVEIDNSKWWQRESDGEYFPRYVTPRLALTSLGTEWGRRLFSEIWVHKYFADAWDSEVARHVIPDVRFLNEVTAIRKRGGYVIRLLRGECTSTHKSELEIESIPLTDFDFVIDNTGPKEALYASLDSIMETLHKS